MSDIVQLLIHIKICSLIYHLQEFDLCQRPSLCGPSSDHYFHAHRTLSAQCLLVGIEIAASSTDTSIVINEWMK